MCNYVSIIFLCDNCPLFTQHRVRFMSCDCTAGLFRPNLVLSHSLFSAVPTFRPVTEQNPQWHSNTILKCYAIPMKLFFIKKWTPAQCSAWLNYGFKFTNDLPNWLTLLTKRKKKENMSLDLFVEVTSLAQEQRLNFE